MASIACRKAIAIHGVEILHCRGQCSQSKGDEENSHMEG